MKALKVVKAHQDQTHEIIEQYRCLDQQIKLLQKRKDELADTLKTGHFLNHSEYVIDGRLLMTCNTITKVLFDSKRFQEERPKVYEQYLKETTYKTLLLK